MILKKNKPTPALREDIAASEEIKDLLARWRDECPERMLEPRLWAALNPLGFDNIRLRYENPHHLWRFSFKFGSHARQTSREVEKTMRLAFSGCGSLIGREFIAAIVEGDRVRGGFVLQPRSTPQRH